MKNKDNITILKNVQVSSFNGSDRLTGITLSDGKNLLVNGLFVAIGGMPDLRFLNGLDIDMKDGYILTDDKMESSLNGLYAIGDVRYKNVYQIITAASDGAIAAVSIKEGV